MNFNILIQKVTKLFFVNIFFLTAAPSVETSSLGLFHIISNTEKAKMNLLTVNTVKSHTFNLFSKYGAVDTAHFSIYITDDDVQFKLLTNHNIPLWATGFAKGNKAVIKSPQQRSMSYETFNKILMHEISHIYLNRINKRFPQWFNEGFCMYNAGEFNINRKINISWNLLLNKVVNLSQLNNFLSKSKSESYLYYSQSGASIEAIFYYYGSDILDSILYYTKKGNSFYKSFNIATKGDSVDEFSVKYIDFINSHYRFLFFYKFQKFIFFIFSLLLLIIWFHKKRKNKKIMQLWEIEEDLEGLKDRKNEDFN